MLDHKVVNPRLGVSDRGDSSKLLFIGLTKERHIGLAAGQVRSYKAEKDM